MGRHIRFRMSDDELDEAIMSAKVHSTSLHQACLQPDGAERYAKRFIIAESLYQRLKSVKERKG